MSTLMVELSSIYALPLVRTAPPRRPRIPVHHRDVGCEFSPSCLVCPRARCKFDHGPDADPEEGRGTT